MADGGRVSVASQEILFSCPLSARPEVGTA